MKRIKLPPIVEPAKKRPLGVIPGTGAFIYYDDVERGSQKLIPLEELGQEELVNLAVERQFSDEPGGRTVTLNGQSFTKEQLAREIRSKSKIGKWMLDANVNYLKHFLSQFPKECFER